MSRINSSPRLRSFVERNPLGASWGRVLKLLCHHLWRQEPLALRVNGRMTVTLPEWQSALLELLVVHNPEDTRVEDIEEIIQKQVKKARQLLQKEMEPYGLNVLNSPLSEEITYHCTPRKFMMPSFGCYLGVTDPI